MLQQARNNHEAHGTHAARAGRTLFFVLLGFFCLPGIASALVALGVALALITATDLVRSLRVRVGRAARSWRGAASGAAPLSEPPVEDVPPVVLVGEVEVEGGLG